jgi:hypothetical protein
MITATYIDSRGNGCFVHGVTKTEALQILKRGFRAKQHVELRDEAGEIVGLCWQMPDGTWNWFLNVQAFRIE